MTGRPVYILIFLRHSPTFDLRNMAGYNTHALDRTDNGICRKGAVTSSMSLATVLCVM
jgi:hypothetical protein